MNLHNELLNRVKRTWELIRPVSTPHRVLRNADPLIKINLPPLLGRRDAAYDQASRLVENQELFAHDEAYRQTHYETIAGLFAIAADDTKSILMMLSSPDTASREKGFYELILLLQNIVEVLRDFTKLGGTVLPDENPTLKHFGIVLSDTERVRGEQIVSEIEISTVNQLRLYCARSLPKITRYREYTAKSFSKPYASRYQKAYDLYSKVFADAVKAR
ncbi:MAG: hypothetical protein LBM70_07930 [Victivallales bacterium]|jgi:hypothetical protein|nr:hypothetical protein [Victivallales bacterium]